MTPIAGYAQRLAVLPGLFRILELHPEGLPRSELAAELTTDPQSLRETLLAYYRIDLVELGDLRLPVIELLGPGGDDEADPAAATWVRVDTADPERELGVEHLSAEQLGQLYQAGTDLLALEPDNEVLRAAVRAFSTALFPAEGTGWSGWKAAIAQQLHRAVAEQLRVRITYVRQWQPGRSERTIEPYRLSRTRRGWEVDAGPGDEAAPVRTFLVSGIETCEVLAETFDRPVEVDELVTAHRAPTSVQLVVPQTGRWAVERFAESVTVLDDDEEVVSLRAELLPPVEQRLGLLLLCCGPEAFVMAPAELRDAGAELARTLLHHHGAQS